MKHLRFTPTTTALSKEDFWNLLVFGFIEKKEVTKMIDSDALMDVLNWLENLRDAGLTLDEVIEGIENGTLTEPRPSIPQPN